MAENVQDNSDQLKQLAGSRPSSVTKEERENRARSVRERQYEERQRKLEEIKAQAFAAQRFKEQKELERRQRLDELRNKEDSRRALVEERKRAINEAERDRLESILKRNQEREARMDAKKRNERSSMVFAFGSSTPRMLDDIGPYCGPRRATSTQNIMSASVMSTSVAAGVPSYGTAVSSDDGPEAAPGTGLTRRQSEREFDASGKKRATSAGGLERTGDVGTGQQPQATTPAGCVSGYVGRRRTDLVPTIPLKDTSSLLLGSPSSSRLNSANGTNGTKSRSSPAPSRPGSAMSQQSTTSIASSAMGSSTVHVRTRPITAPMRKPRPISIAVTGITSAACANGSAVSGTKPPLPKSRRHAAAVNRSQDRIKKSTKVANQQQPLVSPTETPVKQQENICNDIQQEEPEVARLVNNEQSLETMQANEEVPSVPIVEYQTIAEDVHKSAEPAATVSEDADLLGLNDDMTASMMSKVRINTEEQAKAALAEKRRIAREEAEKQAEMERLRVEDEIRAEQEKQLREEDQQRVLIEEMKAAEQKRLEEAIKLKQLEEEEERQRMAEETRQKVLKEEAERRAKEEAERQKVELEERMRNEEKEREQRRKRVEAIMLRTRGKNAANTSPPQSEEKSEKLNGSNPDVAENGHKHGKNIETVDNIIPVDTLKNANIIETLSSDDALNSNNAWQITPTTDLLM